MEQEQMKRLNALAVKARSEEGLTEEEKAEQASLREQYINDVKSSLREQLAQIDIQQEDGSVKPLKRKTEK